MTQALANGSVTMTWVSDRFPVLVTVMLKYAMPGSSTFCVSVPLVAFLTMVIAGAAVM